MKVSAIKRKIIRELPNNVELTTFQKERLYVEILCIRADHEVARRFTEFVMENKAEIETVLNDLDVESKDEIKTIIENLEFMSSHTLVEAVQKFTSNREKLLEHLYKLESIKNKYKLPLELHEEAIFKYKHGLKYVPKEVIKALRNKVFLDCGAFTGDSALMFEKEYYPSRIYSFEPITENYEYLLETIKLNNLKKVIPIQKGVGEEECIANFSSLGAASSCVAEEGDEKIELISIDEFVKEHDLSIGLIKMDIEGYEFEAIKGAKNTIENFRPVLLISIYHHPEELFGTKKFIQEIVPDYNFKIKQLADIRPLGEIHLIAW
jgi:FkbM family methyltransferase